MDITRQSNSQKQEKGIKKWGNPNTVKEKRDRQLVGELHQNTVDMQMKSLQKKCKDTLFFN
jgi:hypothetical protein